MAHKNAYKHDGCCRSHRSDILRDLFYAHFNLRLGLDECSGELSTTIT